MTLSRDLRFFWPLATDFLDRGPRAQHPHVHGPALGREAGRPCAVFDGTDDYLATPLVASAYLDRDEYTLAARVCPVLVVGGSEVATIFGVAVWASTPSHELVIHAHGGWPEAGSVAAPRLSCYIYGGDMTYPSPSHLGTYAFPGPLMGAQWLHLAFTKRRGDCTVYLDGRPVHHYAEAREMPGPCQAAAPFYAGLSYGDGAGWSPFRGGMADVGFWTRALDPAGIVALAHGEGLPR